jgi:uncharacterized protein (DUF697 family)
LTDFNKERTMDSKNDFLRDLEADKVINTAVIKSMVGGAIPIPFIDIAVTTAVQVGMIKRLCGLYGVEYTGKEDSALISSLVSSVGAKFGASLVKSIPLIGGILGAPTMITLSGVLTYATGKAFIQYIKANKAITSFKDFDLGELTDKIKKNLSDGANHVKEQAGKILKVDIEEKLKDISNQTKSVKKPEEAKSLKTDMMLKTIMEKAAKIFSKEEDVQLWLNSKNKLSGKKTPNDLIKAGNHAEVSQWLDVLESMKDEYYLNK